MLRPKLHEHDLCNTQHFFRETLAWTRCSVASYPALALPVLPGPCTLSGRLLSTARPAAAPGP